MSSLGPPALERCYKQVQHYGEPHWECRFCSGFGPGGVQRYTVASVKNSSGNAWRHIRSKHPAHHVALSDPETDSTYVSDVASVASPPSAAAAAAAPAPKRAVSPSAATSATKKTKQTTLSLESTSPKALTREMAITFATEHLSFRLADKPRFRGLLRSADFPKRKVLQAAMLEVAKEYRTKLLNRLRQATATTPLGIAFDGWTNVKGQKVTNILL